MTNTKKEIEEEIKNFRKYLKAYKLAYPIIYKKGFKAGQKEMIDKFEKMINADTYCYDVDKYKEELKKRIEG